MKNKIIKSCRNSFQEKNFIHLQETEFAALNDEIITEILQNFSGKCLIKLPESEIKFFEWLKKNDFSVWKDIWESENDAEFRNENYLVSVNLLPVFMNFDGRGLPICDLQNVENYFFSMNNFVEEATQVLEAVRELFKNRKPLTIAQMLVLEISIEPIDIWHFAYRHKFDLQEAKKAVNLLVEDDILVHLKEAEYVLPFIHF